MYTVNILTEFSDTAITGGPDDLSNQIAGERQVRNAIVIKTSFRKYRQ